MMIYDAVVIGGGVIGCAVARELSRFAGRFALLEKEEDICCGTSKANSAIIHAGFDAKPNTHMAKMNVKGNAMMDRICAQLDIPFKRCGALVLCFAPADLPKLQALYDRGLQNGVQDLQILTREQALALEPALADTVCGALLAPSSGIVCPFEMTAGYGENAAKNGVDFFFNAPVTGITSTSTHYTLQTPDSSFCTKAVINCAGVHGDEIHNFICADKLTITPRRGEYVLCDRQLGKFVAHTLFQLPTPLGKGILVSPTVHGNLLLGPTAQDIDDKEDISTSANGIAAVLQKAALSVKNLPLRQGITSFSGLRAHTQADDFILQEAQPNYFEAVGIESPGLSSAPAIGVYMAQLVGKKLQLAENPSFDPSRQGVVRAADLPPAQRAALIAKEPAYGQLICRCEMISEGEILSAIHRPLGARTLDGIKRRTRAGMGRCQSGFCSPRVMDILAKALNLPLEAVRKRGEDAYLVLTKTPKGGGNNHA